MESIIVNFWNDPPKRRKQTTHIRVHINVKRKLDKIKRRLGMSTYSDVISFLISIYENAQDD